MFMIQKLAIATALSVALIGGCAQKEKEVPPPVVTPAPTAPVMPVEPAPVVTEPAPVMPAGPVTHTVARGETLFGIAKKYGVTMMQVIEWNNLKNTGSKSKPNAVLKVGQTLVVSQ